MELKEVERSCCVVRVFEATTKKGVSCSGVIIDPHKGRVLSSGVPFARFLTHTGGPPGDRSFLSPRSFSSELRVSISLPTAGDQSSQSARDDTRSPPRSKSSDCEASAELLMLVNCLEFQRALQTPFLGGDQWSFYGDQEEDELIRDAQFLSWFAVLQVAERRSHSGFIPWRSSSYLQKGLPVVACGSPFGSLCLDLFISTLSRGIVSNLSGQDNAVILTDARCLPGTEGGGLFVVKGRNTMQLVGLIVSPFGWKAKEWIGLTLVCSVHAIFRNIVHCMNIQNPLGDAWLHPGGTKPHMSTAARGSEAVKYPTVCLVDSVQFWGSGVLVTPQMVMTCRHVVNGKPTVTLKFHIRNRVHVCVGDVLFSTKSSSPYDLALVQLRDSVTNAVVPQMAQNFNPGDSVVVLGFGALDRSAGPSFTCGILSKSIGLNGQPVMLQTTCAVQAGSSGGAVVQRHSGELLGIVSSNTRDFATQVTYPHLNFSIPVTVFQELLRDFNQTKDVNVFKLLDTTDEQVRRVWRLQGVQSKI
ncbi:peroxisomal leader peptide-processing protease [Antennarius striatus]|uniref:peroxisomal leader peptide-processing protease n=1 Tax=Antennarius striatus TaxID=241820 RepID=UPI0035B2637D